MEQFLIIDITLWSYSTYSIYLKFASKNSYSFEPKRETSRIIMYEMA